MSTPTSTTDFFTFTSTFPSTPPTSTGNSNDSFIGNKPSTILFFIALCVGICIAVLFFFFTIRYFVRTRFGLYVPVPVYPRHPFALGPPPPTIRPFVGVHQLFSPAYVNTRNDGSTDPYNLLLRARREGAWANMYKRRQLTPEEVDQLFPIKTYAKWLAGGKEDVKTRTEGILTYGDEEDTDPQEQQQEEEEGTTNNLTSTISNHGDDSQTGEGDSTNLDSKNLTKTQIEEVDITEINNTTTNEISPKPTSTTSENAHNDELHFSSGTCAICLEDFEDDDTVRGLLCGHCFHHDCVETWLIERRASCPICKRDYYMKDRADDGSSIFGSTAVADHVFFPRTTKFRAIALLAALYDIRSGRYTQNNNENNNDSSNEESSSSNAPSPNTSSAYNNINIEEFQLREDLPANYPPIPTLPPYDQLDSEIHTIVNRRPFNPEDLKDLDYLAHVQSVKITPWFSKLFWFLMGISRRDIFYHFVVVEFQDRRMRRIRASRANGRSRSSEHHNNNATSPYANGPGHQDRAQTDADLNSRRLQAEVLV